MKTQNLANGVVTSYNYDNAGKLLTESNACSGNILTSFGEPTGIQYTGAGCVQSYTMAGLSSSSRSFTYGGALSMTSDQFSSGYDDSYQYDAAGNATTLRVLSPTYNYDNQITSTVSGGSSAFVYDGNGNPTTYAGTTLAFDVNDKLKSYGTAASMTYNDDGQRATETGSGATTYYLYDGSVPVCEMNSSGTVTALNVFGPNGLISRTPYSGGTQGAPTYYTFDPQGNVIQTTNSSGTVTATPVYDAYGAMAYNSAVYPFGFGGQFGYYTDAATQKVLCGERWYDPANARWLTRDPIGTAGGTNVYGYCAGNPVGGVDPLGLSEVSWLDILGQLNGSTIGSGAITGGYGLLQGMSFGLYQAPASIERQPGYICSVGAGAVASASLAAAGIGAGACAAARALAAARVSAAYAAGGAAGAGGTEIVYRWMSGAELWNTASTGLLRGGWVGDHFVTDELIDTAEVATQRLALPQTPDVCVRLSVPQGVLSDPTIIKPAFGMPGGGMQRFGTGDIPVTILGIHL